MIKHVLFDLDGTLADTAPDLANALNAVRETHQLEPLSLDTIRPTVSLGGAAMIKLAFGLEEQDDEFPAIRDEFLGYYRDNIANESTLFEGIEEVLQSLEAAQINWGIVTNKTTWLTTPLLKELQLDKRTRCIVCGDTTEYRKPHPAPIIHACELLQSQPVETVYIGDAERDIQAGRQAGTHTLIAMYGYIEENADPENWQADGMVHSPREINESIDALCRNQ